ncbi:right-handed parallel beta-helix repeat-containing protein [Alicyclobacillus fastidiosus]|uniref:right-handed parallel beta-helix repeat-containing protein n=1 Tax=Alicyclobacillus fastidiosus TaxID=392011 RepID=UPI002DD44FBC|nr:right-handed parallel beta-helix repeat-containing protein [Alicyclobacillus fastidiosus]
MLAAGKDALTDLTIRDNVITNNALGTIPKGVDYEALHLVGVQNSFVLDNQSVKNKDGGLQLSDETAPSFGDVISGNTAENNAIDCGITIVSHVAGHGTYNNTISNNWSEGNAAGGIMLATPVPGGIVSNNTVTNNHVENNGRY